MFKISCLDKLVHDLTQLPGLGPKSAQRLTHHLLKTPSLSTQIRESLAQVESQIQLCQKCFNYTDQDQGLCDLCSDSRRNEGQLCVVEQPEDILQIESSGAYQGFYHVLHGALSPLDGITPETLKIPELLRRVRGQSGGLREIILALGSDLEGDTTLVYLSEQLNSFDLKVTRLAQGIPLGSDIDYIDNRTLQSAMFHRTEV